MLQEAKDLQKRAVDNLVHQIKIKDDITFKSPTGSGKTYMMADFMNRILEMDNNIIFLVSSLSKGDLAHQNYDKFCEYSDKGLFSNIKPHLISSQISGEERLFIPLEFNVYLLPRDLYKKGGRLMQGSMESFLQNITLNSFFGGQEKKVYLVKDECHIATNNLDDLSDAFFTKTLNLSATPNMKRGQHPDVEITVEDAVNAKLIKDIEIGDENDTVADAINKFESIKKDYRNLLGVNPCLIIQISNKEKADYELNNIIFPELNKIEHQDLKWMLIVDDDKLCDTNDILKTKKIPVSKWKNYAKSNTAAIDVIIFKMVITEGWDIPRACMLYQVRDSKSKQLDEQVMGRVRRNPRLIDFQTLSEDAQKLAMTAWIWGVIPNDMKKTYAVKLWEDKNDVLNEIKVITTKLKPITSNVSFNLKDFINKQELRVTNSNIFSLWHKLMKADNSVQNLCYEYSTSFSEWWDFTENIDAISKESHQFLVDYTKSMEVYSNETGQFMEVSFPIVSHYTDNGNYINITDWVWKRTDGKDKFSFDSDAEREWASILKDLSMSDNFDKPVNRATKRITVGKKNPNAGQRNLFGEIEPEILDMKNINLWGKNFMPNSDIKFEYYLGAIRKSYPDFIMKDSYDRIHIFEVKSVNVTSNMSGNFDSNEYKIKVNELKKSYLQASLLTNQIFYLPVLKEDVWQITQCFKGSERTITKEQFIEFILIKP